MRLITKQCLENETVESEKCTFCVETFGIKLTLDIIQQKKEAHKDVTNRDWNQQKAYDTSYATYTINTEATSCCCPQFQ
jgi:hypothetical protein